MSSLKIWKVFVRKLYIYGLLGIFTTYFLKQSLKFTFPYASSDSSNTETIYPAAVTLKCSKI